MKRSRYEYVCSVFEQMELEAKKVVEQLVALYRKKDEVLSQDFRKVVRFFGRLHDNCGTGLLYAATSGSDFSLTSFTYNELQLDADEYWAYGGHEHYTIFLDVRFILEPRFLQEELDRMNKQIDNWVLREQELQVQKELKKAEAEKALYEQLKEKYGN